MSDAALIVGKIRQIRRRQFLMRIAGVLGIACCLFGIIAVTFTFESLRFYRSPGLWLCLLGAGLGAAALTFSFLSMPSWKETVKQVDRKLNLQQRLETAWECLSPREEIDRLLLMDAGRRLSAISPESVVPARINRATGILFVISLLAFSTLSLVRLLAGTGSMEFAAAGKPRQIAAEKPVESDAGTGEAAAKSRGNGTSPDSTDPAGTSVHNTPEGSDRTLEETSDSAVLQESSTTSGSEGRDAVSSFIRNESASAASPIRQTVPGETNSAADRSHDMAGAENSQPKRTLPDPAGNRDGRDSSGPSSAGISNRKKTGNTEGAAAGAQYARVQENDTGEIPAAGKAKQSTDTDPTYAQDASIRKRLSSDYPSRRVAAERALSRENIPPGLKKYIADYFRAIQP
ncbi:MAG: hypothetical protein JXR49_15920 [Acidobacteria bacterium]|nr:hypothetical protein [Acidobacteriota bacterium]